MPEGPGGEGRLGRPELRLLRHTHTEEKMSGAALDMTLDDLIKSNKKPAARGRGRAAGPGPARRQPNRSANRAAPYAAPKAPESAWGHDMFSAGGRASNIETGTKLYISNLDYGVSNEDVKISQLNIGKDKAQTTNLGEEKKESKKNYEPIYCTRFNISSK